MSLRLKNARIFGHAEAGQLVIERGVITAIAPAAADLKAETEIDCEQDWLLPSLTDRQVFAHDGFADLDRSAAAGGIAEALVMPGAKQAAPTRARFTIAAPIAYGQGEEEKLAEIGRAHQAGIDVFCNGGAAIGSSALMRRAMSYIADFDALLIHQPQDLALADGGVMNEGVISARLGLKGIPHEAETIMLARDIELARLTGCRTHIAQISTAGAVDMIAQAKAEGVPLSCGVSINHLLLNETAIGDFRTFCKLTPPLRTEADRQALIKAVKDGIITVIISAHNPQSQETKRLPFELAEQGSVGMETLLPALFALHQEEALPLETLITAAASRRITEGASADLIRYAPNAPWQLDVAQTPLRSKAQNAALDGRAFYGKIVMCLLAGEVVFDARSD